MLGLDLAQFGRLGYTFPHYYWKEIARRLIIAGKLAFTHFLSFCQPLQ